MLTMTQHCRARPHSAAGSGRIPFIGSVRAESLADGVGKPV